MSADDGGGSRPDLSAYADLLDCRTVACSQRASCNRRVLAALTQIRSTTAEARSYQSPVITQRQIAVALARQERLRTFVAPEWECRPPRSMCSRLPAGLGAACQAVNRLLTDAAVHYKRPGDQDWKPPKPGEPIELDSNGIDWLSGRWDGWITFDDGRIERVWLRIARSSIVRSKDGKAEGALKVCSDHGMVLGIVKDGVLQLPRREALDLGSRMVLWKTLPFYQDLEGVVRLEVEPGRDLQTGQVWLSRRLSQADALTPTDYACQDKEIIDTRSGTGSGPWTYP